MIGLKNKKRGQKYIPF
nr:unnamed protein product [Callosobruchus analis]